MGYVLVNNRSAIECWERGIADAAVPLGDRRELPLAGDVGSFKAAMQALTACARPVEALVARREQRNHSDACRLRVWGKPFPPGSVYLLPGTNVAISAPWFCYLQMAARMPLVQAMLLGMELCGGYSTLPFSRAAVSPYRPTPREAENGYVDRRPLLGARQLVDSVRAVLPPDSEAKALVAARGIAQDARSPAEARHYLQLFSPVRRGGYGLPRPMLNVGIPLPARLARLSGRSEYVCDFLYPGKRLAIEYDGGYHWNGEQRLDDNLRELILGELQIEVVRIDKHQLASEEAADICARAIAKRLGVRLGKPCPSSLANRRDMRRQLLDRSFDLYA